MSWQSRFLKILRTPSNLVIVTSDRNPGVIWVVDWSLIPPFLLFIQSNEPARHRAEHSHFSFTFSRYLALHWWRGIWLYYKISPYHYLRCHHQAFTLVNMCFLITFPELLTFPMLPPHSFLHNDDLFHRRTLCHLAIVHYEPHKFLPVTWMW